MCQLVAVGENTHDEDENYDDGETLTLFPCKLRNLRKHGKNMEPLE